MEYPIWMWAGFTAFILFILGLDLGFFNRHSHVIRYREALAWSAVWMVLALGFFGLVYWKLGHDKGIEFLTGYLIEKALSVDNLFVFLIIFSYFQVPSKLQHRVLFWGVLGALVMRFAMILVGAELIERFHWVIYIFGAFLVYTGIKMFRHEDVEIHPEENSAVRLVTRFVPMSREYDGENFFTHIDGRRVGTLLLLVLVVVEVTDVVFAVDSIPAIFGITTDRFIVYTSNVFAILGLRALYFLLAGVVEKFHYLKTGLAIVLSFIGVKMLVPLVLPGRKIPTHYALLFVGIVLAGSVVASLILPQPKDAEIEVDLPPEYDGPSDDPGPDEAAAESEVAEHR